MLGGSYWISLLRNGIGATLMMAVFLLLDRPRFPMRKTALLYILFGIGMSLGFSAWYVLDQESFVRFAGLACMPPIGIFCGLLSEDGFYLSLYKISLSFYLLSICVFFGVDISRWLFGWNMWVDILIRFLLAGLILAFIAKRFRKAFFERVEFLRGELDWFSTVTLVLSVILASFAAYLPADRSFSFYSMLRIFAVMLMAGIIQYLVFYLYYHLGVEHCYQAEKQLLEMNEQFLCRQLELERKSQEEAARIRHDVRHHCMLISEYVKNGDTDSLLSYLEQYREDVESTRPKRICANKAVNGILAAYAGYAEKENIRVTMKVEAAEKLAVRDIDLVAILANIFENAIKGCLSSGKPEQKIHIDISQKGHKIVIQCKNSCAPDVRFHKGLPRAEKGDGVGVSCIMRTASRYDGETDFLTENGMFVVRVLLNQAVSPGARKESWN